ncbi:MAG: SDR family oxidoreductase [Alphaproteobacteria bacterium]|nr:MAG: SDR family oxidoreductase [Alphaproteobacteria bacterium]
MELSAIVTGGGGDIGRAIGRRLAAAGYRVGLLDLAPAEPERAAAAIPGAAGLVCDVTDPAAVEAALARFGVPDLLVNNAGIGRFAPLMDIDIADFRAVLKVNLEGAFIMARACARGMAERGGGAIVNITSLNALTAGPGAGAYPAAKAGLARLTEQMAQEWGPLGIRVNAVAPGFIDAGISTPFYRDPEVRALRAGAVPARRLGTAEDVAEAVAFLASGAAAYVNGVQLPVDGGVAVSLLSQLPRSRDKG